MALVRDRERLVAALHERGVGYLAPRHARGEPVDDQTLIASLAASEEARLRQALIALFLLQPRLAPLVRELQPRLSPPVEVELVAHYMAAVYLRQIWAVRLKHYLPLLPELPDYFSQQLQLPSPHDRYGEAGLHALAAWHERSTSRAGNRLEEYHNAAELLFGQLKLRARPHVAASTG
jgi:hypothetical protein